MASLLAGVIKGRVVDKKGRPVMYRLVYAYDKDALSRDDYMGKARTNKKGRLTIRFKNKAWDAGLGKVRRPDIYLKIVSLRS